MIDAAIKYATQLEELMIDTWYDDKYKFYYPTNQRTPFKLDTSLANVRSFAVIDPTSHQVIGHIEYWFDSDTNSVSGLTAINFTDNKILFGMDLAKIIDDIFCKFHFNRLEFSVIRGNPIEASYDKMVKKYGGRIIGTRTAITRLIDGDLYDDKLYEIMKEDYLHAKDAKEKKKKESVPVRKSCPFGDPDRYNGQFNCCIFLQPEVLLSYYTLLSYKVDILRQRELQWINPIAPNDMFNQLPDMKDVQNIDVAATYQDAFIVEEVCKLRGIELPFLIEYLPWREKDNKKGE